MNSEISDNYPAIYEEYKRCYRISKGSLKRCLRFTTFSKRLDSGKVLIMGNTEFMSHKTFHEWINLECAMLAAHG